MNFGEKINTNKKGGVPIAVAVFVVVVFILMGLAWQKFYVKSKDLQIQIDGANILEKIYAEESQVNFYIGEIVENAAGGMGVGGSEDEFIQNVRNELLKYKIGEGYLIPQLEQVEIQLAEENVEIIDDVVSISLRIKIDESIGDEGYEFISAEYIYEKEFEGKIL